MLVLVLLHPQVLSVLVLVILVLHPEIFTVLVLVLLHFDVALVIVFISLVLTDSSLKFEGGLGGAPYLKTYLPTVTCYSSLPGT